MNISTASRAAVLMRVGLTVAGFAAVSCIADDATSKEIFRSLALPLPSAIVTPSSERPVRVIRQR